MLEFENTRSRNLEDLYNKATYFQTRKEVNFGKPKLVYPCNYNY